MKKLKNGSVLLLLTALLLPAWSFAQDDEGPSWLVVRTVTTNAGQEDIWIEQQRRLAAAHKERGDPSRHVWEEISGNLNTYHVVTFRGGFGGEGGQGGPGGDSPPMGDSQDAWFATTGPTIAARSSMILRTFPELSIPPAEGSEPGLLVLRRTTIAPGRSGDYEDWLTEHLVPALKKTGAAGVNFNRVFSGGDTNLWISGSRVGSMAEATGPGPLNSLTAEERNAIFEARGEGVIWLSERMLLRYRADMSHVTADED